MNLLDHEQILTYQMNFMGLSGASLSNYQAQEQHSIFHQPSQSCINKTNQVNICNIYSIKKDINSNLKAFAVAMLRAISQNKKNNDLCDHIKCHLYNNKTILTCIKNRPYDNLGSEMMKKLFVEMFQMLKYGNYTNKTYIKLSKYPIILSLFAVYLRVILSELNVVNASDYSQKVPTQQSFENLIEFFDLDCYSQDNIYFFKQDEIILSSHDNKQFMIGNYSNKSYSQESSVKQVWKANRFGDQDQDSNGSDEDFIYNKLQKESQIITPQFQNLIQSENNFKKRKSSFYNKETPMKQLGKRQEGKQEKPNIFTQIIQRSHSIDRLSLWNQPHHQSQGEEQQQNQGKVVKLTDNPETIKKTKLALSIQSEQQQQQKVVQVIVHPKLYYIDSPKPKQNNQFINKFKESKKQIIQNQKKQEHPPPKQNEKNEQFKNLSKIQIKKWYPFKKITKAQSLRQQNFDEVQKNPMDSDIFNTEINSSSFEINNKTQKNTLNSKIISISYTPPVPTFRKPQTPFIEPWKRTNERTSMILMKQPSVCINPNVDSGRRNSRLLTEASGMIVTSRTISKSPIQYQPCANTSRISYKPQINQPMKPKVSFIYGQAPIKNLSHQTRPTIKSQYQPYNNNR